MYVDKLPELGGQLPPVPYAYADYRYSRTPDERPPSPTTIPHTTTFRVTDRAFCVYTNPSRATIPLIRPHQCDSEGGRIIGVLLALFNFPNTIIRNNPVVTWELMLSVQFMDFYFTKASTTLDWFGLQNWMQRACSHYCMCQYPGIREIFWEIAWLTNFSHLKLIFFYLLYHLSLENGAVFTVLTFTLGCIIGWSLYFHYVNSQSLFIYKFCYYLPTVSIIFIFVPFDFPAPSELILFALLVVTRYCNTSQG